MSLALITVRLSYRARPLVFQKGVKVILSLILLVNMKITKKIYRRASGFGLSRTGVSLSSALFQPGFGISIYFRCNSVSALRCPFLKVK